jgi:hypothetical protein
MAPGGSGTSTGSVLELTIVPAALANGYSVQKQVYITPGLGGGRQRLDALITAPNGDQIDVSVKWQGGSGSVEEKVPAEILKMLTLLDHNPQIKRAYIVLAGPGWSVRLKQYYRSGDIAQFIPRATEIKILETDEYIHLCNQKKL